MLFCGIGELSTSSFSFGSRDSRGEPGAAAGPALGGFALSPGATWAQLKPQYCILAAMILHIDDLRFDWLHILVSSNKMTEGMLVELAENSKAQVA